MQRLVLNRLGKIDWVMVAPNYVQARLAESIDPSEWLRFGLARPVPVILYPSTTVEVSIGNERHRASSVQTLAVPKEFWNFDTHLPSPIIEDRSIAVNESLARELGVKVGDLITLRIPASQAVPADSPLGRREDQTISIPRLTLAAIFPDESIAGFSLLGNQSGTKNAFLSLSGLQSALRREGQVNALFFGSSTKETSQGALINKGEMDRSFWTSFAWSLEDFGIALERIQRVYPDAARQETSDDPPQTILDYFQISSRQLLFSPEVEEAISKVIPSEGSNRVLTYLANAIQKLPQQEGATPAIEVTYSTITGIEWNGTFPQADSFGFRPPRPGETVINEWLANRMELSVGDRIRVFYYLPETSYGNEVEEHFDLEVTGIVPLTQPMRGYDRRRLARFDRPPTPFNDPDLTPEVPGITDQNSIYDWDTPFPLQRKVSIEDDNYWKDHRLTPKLYLSLAEAQERFGSRFGRFSSFRVQPDEVSYEELSRELADSLASRATELGFQMIPIRHRLLTAASGTTPFDSLFLALSFFVIVSGLILAWLLFRLGIEQRADQLGLLASCGWTTSRILSFLAWEALLLSTLGGLLGVVLGWLYANAMIAGLKTFWVGAIATPFLEFQARWTSLLIGYISGAAITWLTTTFSVFRLIKLAPLQLLRGRVSPDSRARRSRRTLLRWIGALLFVLAVFAGMLGLFQSSQARVLSFFTAGMLLLTSTTLYAYHRLSQRYPAELGKPLGFPMLRLARFSIHANPLRSTLSVGMISVATFLITALSIFQAKPDMRSAGGFTLVGESSQPIVKDLNDPSYRRVILGDKAEKLRDIEIIPMRLKIGDNASCSNLFQSSQPRILGVPPELEQQQAQRQLVDQFPWDSAELPNAAAWSLLEEPASGSKDQPIPVVIDQNTALWSLHRSGSIGEVFSYEYDDRVLHFRTVGLLRNSVLQGALLIGRENLERAFPSVVGYQFFLINAPSENLQDVSSVLEDGWNDLGLDVVRSEEILKTLLGVQNTYLSAFQALGALGLLIGTIGLAVIQIRTVVERRSELALLKALGFSNGRLGAILLLENALLLIGGAIAGVLCASLSILPSAWQGQPLADFQGPLLMVVFVLVIGLLAGVLAARRAIRLPLLDALRGK